MTRMHAGFAGVVQDRVGRGRAASAHAERLDAAASTRCPASARRSRSGCARSGIAAGRRPAPARAAPLRGAADEVAISQLWGDEEVAIAGVVRDVRTRRLGGRRTIVTARVEDASGSISASWFNQPWLAEQARRRARTCGCAGKLGRYGFDVKSYDVGEARATADFAPVYPASEQVPSTRLRELVRAALAAARARRPRPAAGRARAAAAARRARGAPLPRRRGARPRRRAGGSRSTSSSRCSSPSPRSRDDDAVATAARRARRAGRAATARRCRSR